MESEEFLKKHEIKQDLKKLIKLHKEILDMNFNNKDLYILTDELSTKVNDEISNFMKNNNINYEEYKKMAEDVDRISKEEKYYHNLGEDRLYQIFEACNVHETVEILMNMGCDKNFIINCFSDSENMLEASRKYSIIEEEPFIYEDKENDIYVTKDDLSFIYGEKELENKTEEELESLGKSLADNFIEYSKNSYLLDFSEYVVDQAEYLEKAKEVIKEFCENEYGEDYEEDEDVNVDFSNLSKVDIAYSITEDGKYNIQTSVDLINNSIVKYLDNNIYEKKKFSSLKDLTKEIGNTTFSELVSIDLDEETEEDEL